ncbi:hypothetical protein EI94DRAFT_1807629 [Lactarius quietus]|nr:hypothetical protein EI94DRAFT_1807629 [Lactarius quietus]
MHSISTAFSTAAFLSVLALASPLSDVVRASGPQPQCAETLDTTNATTCNFVASQFNLTTDQILSMNPGLNCNGTLPAGSICLKMFTPPCTKNATATSTSCDELAAQNSLTTTQFVAYNDDVNADCTNLVVGQSYCVAV